MNNNFETRVQNLVLNDQFLNVILLEISSSK